jgi:hypothetical protein
MHWLRRIVRVAGVALGLILLSLAFASAYLRLDKEDVLRDVRGTYQDFVTLDSWESAQSRFQLLQLRNHRGDAVTDVYFRRPLELDPHYRIFLIYAGAKTRDKILTLIPERSDLVLVSVQYPYDSPDGLLEHLRWPHHIRQAAFRTVAGGMLALSFLHGDEHLDIDRLTVIGVSVGVPFATMHGALDERVPTVVLIHGGGDLPAQVRAIAEPRWIATPASVMAAILFVTFEPLRYVGRIAPRKLVMIAARHDTMLPLETIEKLYARAREPKEMIWTESGHVRSKDTDLIADIVRQIDRYLE